MSPEQNTGPMAHRDVMPGVHDFLITLPFVRPAADGDETVTMPVRLPAANAVAAIQLGAQVAVTVGNANHAVAEPGAAWRPDLAGITAADVDATPSIDELAAELDHWRRIVTVLAHRIPGLAQVDVDEYEQADFSRLALVPVDDRTMMFVDETDLTAPAGRHIASMPAPSATDVVLPDPYGGHVDPDVRQSEVAGLTLLPPKSVEMLHDGRWIPVAGANVTRNLDIEVTLLPPDQEYQTVTFGHPAKMVTTRPLTVEAIAADLPAAAVHGRQILTATGWWTLVASDFRGPIANSYSTLIVKDPTEFDALGKPVNIYKPDIESILTSFCTGDQVLLRDRPGSWWS